MKDSGLASAAQAAISASRYEHLPNGDIHFAPTYDYPIAHVEALGRKIAREKKPLMRIEPAPAGMVRLRLTDLGKDVLKALNADWPAIEAAYLGYTLNPVLQLFLRVIRQVPLSAFGFLNCPMPQESAIEIAANVERVMVKARFRLKSAAMKSAVDNFSRGARDNFARLMNGVDWLAQRHRNVVSVRLDLYLPKRESEPSSTDAGAQEDARRLAGLRDDYARCLRRKFGNSLIATASGLEHGRARGFHVHLWAVFKPAVADDIEQFAEGLGLEWAGMIDGDAACFFNCHKKITKYRYPMIGQVDLHQPDVIDGIRALCTYFTAAALFVKLNIDRLRTFRMWGFPNAPLSKPGPKPKMRTPVMRVPLHWARDRFIKWI